MNSIVCVIQSVWLFYAAAWINNTYFSGDDYM